MALEFSSYASNPFAKKENPGEAKIADERRTRS